MKGKQFKYFGTTLKNQNSIQEEIKSGYVRECLLSLSKGSFVFQCSFQKYKNLDTQNYNTVFCLCGCKTWLLILREVSRLKVFENRVLREISGPKMFEITMEWRKLQNEGLNDLYSAQNIIRVIKSRKMRWAGYIVRMGRGEVPTGFW